MVLEVRTALPCKAGPGRSWPWQPVTVCNSLIDVLEPQLLLMMRPTDLKRLSGGKASWSSEQVATPELAPLIWDLFDL